MQHNVLQDDVVLLGQKFVSANFINFELQLDSNLIWIVFVAEALHIWQYCEPKGGAGTHIGLLKLEWHAQDKPSSLTHIRMRCRYPTQGLQPSMLGDDMQVELKLEDDLPMDAGGAAAAPQHEYEGSLRAVGQLTVGTRNPGPVHAAIIKHCRLQPGDRIGQVESYRYHCLLSTSPVQLSHPVQSQTAQEERLQHGSEDVMIIHLRF